MADQWSGGQTSPQWNGGQSGPGERWNVNLPAVIGVVFVFLVGVIVWVIVASGDDDGQITTGTLASTVASTTSSPSVQTTTPPPMPSTSVVVVPTVPPPPLTSAPATAPPPIATAAPAPPPIVTSPPAPPPPPPPTAAPTAAPTNPPTTVAPPSPPPPGGGDLGVPGHPMQRPPCDGGFITVLASAIGDQATADSMGSVIGDYPGSSYLRTDVTCASLNPSSGGRPIYVVYFGPFATSSEACASRSQGPDDAYVRRLSNDLGPNHSVTC